MLYQLPKLPYERNALEPWLSDRIMSFHYEKHHQGYVDKYNELVKNSSMEDQPLEEVVKETFGDFNKKNIFNNAAQIYNHNFFWNSMKPKGGGEPSQKMKRAIQHSFRSFELFQTEFLDKASNLFGSGWVWLVKEGDQLSILQTKDAETPIIKDIQKPLIALDVWEHTYYLDYQNRRADFIKAYLDHLINWDFAEKNL